ncbi:hypothetical protein [Microbacterium sp. 4R-513]|uniref:MarR family winged helix-turn-helix transcriptional regulator n=1 Tax=Microbacterium sp. 4R-513 TaxID=2567934 RepID=UPI0019CF5F5D|nr:hypothetical protein [Microbacterium sp. 4R-513]
MSDNDFDNTGDENPDTAAADEQTPEADRIPTDRRPLGFWLRAVDALISREFESAFADEGVTRRDWMLLNALAGDIDPALAERLARRSKRLRGLEKRGWADEKGDGTWVLTDEGRAAQERLAAIVDGVRQRVAGAVSPEDFATTLASLEAIARELGWDENAAPRGFGRFFGRGFREGDEPDFGPGFRRGFGPGFRPGFGPGFRPGFGPGFPPGFGRGFRPGPGFDPRRAWAEGWSDEDGYRDPRAGHHHHGDHGHHGEHGHHQGEHHGHHEQGHHGEHHRHHGHGFAGDDRGYGWDRPWGPGWGLDPRESRGHDRHGEHRGRNKGDRGQDRRASEQAYERGFDAGYARGAAERD